MPYRILSLSGGGIRGIFQAVYLREAAKHLPGKVSDHFDLIAGTSTGAIIALGVALDIDPSRVVELFVQMGPRIFSPQWSWYLSLFRGSRYDDGLLRKALSGVFGPARLGDCHKPVVITATTLNRFAFRAFSTLGTASGDSALSVVDVLMASCAAPTFFPPVQPLGEERTYVDGGMSANTPSLLAIMQAHHVESVRFKDMRLLNIGNGDFPAGAIAAEFSKRRAINPKLIFSLLDMMFSTQRHTTDEVVDALIGRGNALQINVQLEKFLRLDDAQAAISILPALAEETAQRTVPGLKQFLELAESDDPKETMVLDMMRSLRRYNYVQSSEHEGRLSEILSDAKYIRSQNFYELLAKGLTVTKDEFLFVNDHPFKPFADLVKDNIAPTTRYVGINAVPDSLYSKADIERRITILESTKPTIKYYLLPKNDVHLSILVFDGRVALVYPTPADRDVCNFSEGLLFLSSDAVDLCVSIFRHIEHRARSYMTAHNLDPLDELKKFAQFYAL